MLGYARPKVLVGTQWVAEHFTAQKVRVVEVGYGLSDCNSGCMMVHELGGAKGYTPGKAFGRAPIFFPR